MAPLNGFTTTPHQRQNRRRERPGARARRTLTRKATLHGDLAEGILDAQDNNVYLPSDRSRPSPLLRQSFEQSWLRWRERAAVEKEQEMMRREKEVEEMERVQRGLFDDDGACGVILEEGEGEGTDNDEDELNTYLRRIGVLYTTSPDPTTDPNQNSYSTSNLNQYANTHLNSTYQVPPFPSTSSPLPYIVRHMKPKSTSKAQQQQQRPLTPLEIYLSLSDLSDDTEIARLLTRTPDRVASPIHHSHINLGLKDEMDDFHIPEYEDIYDDEDDETLVQAQEQKEVEGIPVFDNGLCMPGVKQLWGSSDERGRAGGDWTFVPTAHHGKFMTATTIAYSRSGMSTPVSEGEGWCLVD